MLVLVASLLLQPDSSKHAYIVQGESLASVKSAVAAVGGQVTHELGLIDGVGALLTEAQQAELASQASIHSIFADQEVAAETSEPVRIYDTFETRKYSNNDGSLDWATDWVEVGDDASPRFGRVKVKRGVLWLRDDNRIVSRSADLSAYTSAIFNYEFRRKGLDRDSDYVTVEISADGVNWDILQQIGGAGTDATARSASFDISNYLSANTTIRFVTAPTFGRADKVFIDNVEIRIIPEDSQDTQQVPDSGIIIPHELVRIGSAWRYMDSGKDLGTEWRSVKFDDGSWQSGFAKLGYGSDHEVTTLSYGDDANNKHITTYFRQSFHASDIENLGNLEMQIMYDDGAVVYLNDQEIGRLNMPAGEINHETFATDHTWDEDIFHSLSIDPSALVEGRNIIAVEIHQATADSSDIGFELGLRSLTKVDYQSENLIPENAAWAYLDNGSDQGTAWTATTFNDAGWKSGIAQLGFGDDGEVTTVHYGQNPNDKHITTYFRHTFHATNVEGYSALTAHLLRDDGAIVYLPKFGAN
ncbi:MAG: hypothetical protein ACPG8W_25985 [Candidatus Promineifilaceae bacterium]